jgi:hypothetical protein
VFRRFWDGCLPRRILTLNFPEPLTTPIECRDWLIGLPLGVVIDAVIDGVVWCRSSGGSITLGALRATYTVHFLLVSLALPAWITFVSTQRLQQVTECDVASGKERRAVSQHSNPTTDRRKGKGSTPSKRMIVRRKCPSTAATWWPWGTAGGFGAATPPQPSLFPPPIDADNPFDCPSLVFREHCPNMLTKR